MTEPTDDTTDADASTDDRTYEALFAAVAEDPDLRPVEKETGFLVSKTDDRLSVFTTEAGLMRRMLKLPFFELARYRMRIDGHYRTVTAEEYQAEGHDRRRPVVMVDGTIPTGALRVSSSPADSAGHARMLANVDRGWSDDE